MSFHCGDGRFGNARDPKLAKEWFFRDGKVIGYVAASYTTCSTHPDLIFRLRPPEA
jgi:hypothetical protein